jgi:hypothetical protein
MTNRSRDPKGKRSTLREVLEGLSADDRAIADDVASALDESDEHSCFQIAMAVREFGAAKVLELLDEVKANQAKGGMRTNDGTRMRTAGGVFFYFLRQSMPPKTMDVMQGRRAKTKEERLSRLFQRIAARSSDAATLDIDEEKYLESVQSEANTIRQLLDEIDLFTVGKKLGRRKVKQSKTPPKLAGKNRRSQRDTKNEITKTEVKSQKTNQVAVPPKKREPRPKTVTIADVTFSAQFAGLLNGEKYEKDGRWVLATKRGRPVAAFPTEEALDGWWKYFQRSQGREARPLLGGSNQLPETPSTVKDEESPTKQTRATQQYNNLSVPPKQSNGTVVIDDVTVPAQLAKKLKMKNGRKYKESSRWILTSKGGATIAEFATENALDEWWDKFQQSLGRQPKRLIEGKKKPTMRRNKKPTVRRKKTGSSRNTSSTRTFDDYLKPWSDKYGMPEYDFE